MRGLEVHIATADGNLETISRDLLAVSADLGTINDGVAEVAPLLDEYVRIVTKADDLIEQTQVSLSRHLARARLVVVVAMVWMSLMQVAPLYLGWELLMGQRGE